MRAQTSVEYVLILILLLGVLSVMSLASVSRVRDTETAALQQSVDDLLRKTAAAINTAYLEGSGFNTTVVLPQNIAGFAYNVSTSDNFLIITVLGLSYSRPLLTNVSGTLAVGTVTVSNVNGEVRVS